MRKKSGFTIVEQAITLVPEFEKLPEHTNQRILNIAEGKVTFIAKDYRDGAIKKSVKSYLNNHRKPSIST